MAINPGSDLLSDALLAADPQRAKAASERLSALAAGKGEGADAAAAVASAFESTLGEGTEAAQLSLLKGPLSVTIGSQASVVVKPQNPYEQFEAAMLKTFFEAMLPAKADAVFGTGLAGEVWKSMFAESIAKSVARSKSIGIARDLEERARRSKSNS
jgi:peptidoglycan hydrolase FlgJ